MLSVYFIIILIDNLKQISLYHLPTPDTIYAFIFNCTSAPLELNHYLFNLIYFRERERGREREIALWFHLLMHSLVISLWLVRMILELTILVGQGWMESLLKLALYFAHWVEQYLVPCRSSINRFINEIWMVQSWNRKVSFNMYDHCFF